MRCWTLCIATASSVALAGCGAQRAADEGVRVETVSVAVPIGCALDRPAPVVPLNARVPADQWAARAPGAKAQSIRAQAAERMNHADRLTAATAACADAPAR